MNCTQAKSEVLRQQIEFKERRRKQRKCGRWFGRGHAYKQTKPYNFHYEAHPGWTCVCCGYHTYESPYRWQVLKGEL